MILTIDELTPHASAGQEGSWVRAVAQAAAPGLRRRWVARGDAGTLVAAIWEPDAPASARDEALAPIGSAAAGKGIERLRCEVDWAQLAPSGGTPAELLALHPVRGIAPERQQSARAQATPIGERLAQIPGVLDAVFAVCSPQKGLGLICWRDADALARAAPRLRTMSNVGAILTGGEVLEPRLFELLAVAG